MLQLDSACQPYAWGSKTAIAQLQDRPPSSQPEAELWMGAHPSAPSKLPELGNQTLGNWIAASPREALGERVRQDFGTGLPFLFKVLAAAEPLSLQAHPSLAQARAGFARENAAGIARDAPARNYKDANHKPELICALTPFKALCGFRAVPELAALLDELGNPELFPHAPSDSELSGDAALERMFTSLISAAKSLQTHLADTTVAALDNAPADSPFADSFGCARDLALKYPGDIGIVLSLLLNHVTLSPGEALFLPAGNLHAYLEGTGLELMANSDNVLRGGLTPKHVDVTELTRVLRFEAWSGGKQLPEQHAPGQWRYPTTAREFELWRLDVEGECSVRSSDGPEILLLVEGHAEASGNTSQVVHPLQRGRGLFVPASDGDYRLRGHGVVYRALVP